MQDPTLSNNVLCKNVKFYQCIALLLFFIVLYSYIHYKKWHFYIVPPRQNSSEVCASDGTAEHWSLNVGQICSVDVVTCEMKSLQKSSFFVIRLPIARVHILTGVVTNYTWNKYAHLPARLKSFKSLLEPPRFPNWGANRE